MSNEAAKNAGSFRISELLDAGSFVEIGGAVTARNTDFNMQESKVPGDGVITGYGVIDAVWSMCTARMHRYSAEQSERCTQRRLQAFMTWR